MLGYAFVVEYKKGTDNVEADALSRRVEESESAESSTQGCHDSVVGNVVIDLTTSATTTLGTLCIISFPTPTWVVELKASYASNLAIQSILSIFQASGIPPKGFSLVNGPTSVLKSSILQNVHNGPLGGTQVI